MKGGRIKSVLGSALRVFVVLTLLGMVGSLSTPGFLWGLPDDRHYFSYHPDEIFLLLPSFGFTQGDWNPHFFNYGTLYIYLVGIPAVLLHLVPDPSIFPAGLRPLYEQGRATTAMLGTLTVALLYLALRRHDKPLAPVSAALLAVCPLHVLHRCYATVDVPATFFLTLAYWAALSGSQRPDAKMGALTGLTVGLAAATKYNSGLFLIPALVAPYLAPPFRASIAWWISLPLGGLVGFLIGCPYAGGTEFWNGLRFEAEHMRIGGTLAFVGTGSGWTYHLLHGLPTGLGFPLLGAAILGIAVAVCRPHRGPRLALLWTITYLGMIGAAREHFIRYLVPLAPFVCVIAAAGLTWLWLFPRRRFLRATSAGLGLAVIALTASYCIGQVESLIRFDPRDRAWAELGHLVTGPNAPFRAGLVQDPWFFHPPVSPYNAGPFSQALFNKWNERSGNRIVITGWDTKRLAAEHPNLFFLSDLESRDLLRLGRPDATEFVRALRTTYPRRMVYERPVPRFSWLAPGRDSAPPDWLYASPRITAYGRPARSSGT